MAKDTLIDKHVSMKQCEKAIEALHKYTQKRRAEEDESSLFRDEEKGVWLVIALKQMQPNDYKLKPHRIPLAHPTVDPRTTPICLITKDPQRKYKDLLQEKNIKFVSRVVGITKLKGKFKPFEPRRQLMGEYGLFLADKSVIPLLPGLLGKIFFKAKKQPIPINLEHTDLKAHLESAVSSTYLHLNAGTCTSVKIGTTGMAPIKLLKNLQTALPEIIKRLAPTKRRRTEEGGEEEEDPWGNIQSLMIKTSESASLPIWSCQLGSGQGGRWDGLMAEQMEMGVVEEERDVLPKLSAKRKTVGPSLAEPSDTTSNGKRKKRAAADEESKDEPKRKRKKVPVGTDEVVSEMKGLTIKKATPAKREKEAKTEGKTVETSGPTAALVKIKAPSSTSVPPPNPESTRKPRKKTGEEKASREAKVSLHSTTNATTRPPTGTKTGPTKAENENEKGKKTKPKTAPLIEAPPKPTAKDEKPKAEEKKEKKYSKGEKNTKVISTPKPTSLPHAHQHQAQARAQAREKENGVKPLKSAIKSYSLSGGGGGVKEKKRISFDLRSGKEGRGGKKIGGKLSSKERLVGRGPRNA